MLVGTPRVWKTQQKAVSYIYMYNGRKEQAAVYTTAEKIRLPYMQRPEEEASR